MIVFKYKTEESGIIRPITELILKVGDNITKVFLYIDSGADITMIPRSTGVTLGFKEGGNQIKEIGGISGGMVPFIEQKVVMFFDKQTKLEVPVAWALTEEVPPLLGRKGVFDKFKITFDEDRQRVEFVRNKKK